MVRGLRAVVDEGMMIEWSIAAGRIRDEHKPAARIRLQNISSENGALAERSVEAIPLFVFVTDLEQLRPPRISEDSIGIIVVGEVVIRLVAQSCSIGGGNFRQAAQSFPAAHQIRIRVGLTAKYVVYDRGIQVEASELRGEKSRTYNSGSRADQVRTHVRRERVRIPSLRIQFGGNDRSEIRNFFGDARVEGSARVQMIMSGEVNKLSGVHGSQKADALEYLRFD